MGSVKKRSVLLGFGAGTEMEQDYTSLGAHALLGGLMLDLEVTPPHNLIKIIYLLTPETASSSVTAGHNNKAPH